MLAYLLLLLYGGLQVIRLYQFGESVVTFSVKDSYYSMDHVFPDTIQDLRYSDFHLAFGLAAYDGSSENLEDPRYGNLFARYETWGLSDEKFSKLESHKCYEEELGLGEIAENSRFYPIYSNNFNDT